MHLSVLEAAHVLKIPENHVYRLIEEGQLPCYWVNDQARLNRTELLEWATARRMFISTELFNDSDKQTQQLPMLTDALMLGGIHYQITGSDRESVLHSVVSILQLPEDVDREMLLQILLARESAGSTAVGDGIAIPHVRQPIAVNGDGLTSMALCFLASPIQMGNKPVEKVHTLFVMVTPNVRRHLQLLARLATALRDEQFKACVLARHDPQSILQHTRRLDAIITS
ncbi:MAG: PTS sugar transporter subunit IIA [Deltaproteobacteria bacterium]|nr:PTS sugar transporter subunit IIA [Deltaproteobacteria bacterium]